MPCIPFHRMASTGLPLVAFFAEALAPIRSWSEMASSSFVGLFNSSFLKVSPTVPLERPAPGIATTEPPSSSSLGDDPLGDGHTDPEQTKDSGCGFCRDVLGTKRLHSAATCPRKRNYCFHCRKKGHSDATCGLQRLCEVCWKMGHATKNCRYANNGSNAAPTIAKEKSRRYGTNTLWDHSSSSSSLEMVWC